MGLKEKEIDLKVDIGGLTLKNPLIGASGCFGYGLEYQKLFDISCLGAICTKGITLRPSPGFAGRRIVEVSGGILNSIGLENIGVYAFIEEKLPRLTPLGIPVIVNIAGSTIEEYEELAQILGGIKGISALEINVSCPNIKKGGIYFGVDPKIVKDLTRRVKKEARGLPLITKLSPNVTDITEIALATIEGGADAISLINTVRGMAIDVDTFKPKLPNLFGGLSGPCIKPIAIHMVFECYQKVCKERNIPIIGIGGISNARDVIEFLLAGAKAVEVGTANLVDPFILPKILKDLKNYLRKNPFYKDINDLVGRVDLSHTGDDDLCQEN